MHILPGRIRIRLPQLKNNHNLANALVFLLRSKPGIREVVVNPRTGSCLVNFDQSIPTKMILEQLSQTLQKASPGQQQLNKEWSSVKNSKSTGLAEVVTGGAILTLFWGLPGAGRNLPLPITSAALITTGYPIFKRGLAFFQEHKKPNYELMLSGLSLLATCLGQGTLGIFTLWLSNLSEYLQYLTFKTASRSFSNILIKKGNKISLLREGTFQHVLPGDVVPGDEVLFRPGDCSPLEGEVLTGTASIGPGEILAPGDFLEAGTIIERGQITIKVHRLVQDTSLARLADILDDAMEEPEVGTHLALHHSERLLPFTMLITLLVFFFTRDLKRAIPVLLAGAPGPAGLAAPTALSASTGLAAGMGIAVKDPTALERLSHVDVVIFHDKEFSQRQGKLHPALRKLEEEGYQIDSFDPEELQQRDDPEASLESSPEATVDEIHRQGLRVAWVSGPDHPHYVENADINIMFLTGDELQMPKAEILCYKRDPRQVYRLIRLSHKTMHTIQENVFMVQGVNLLGEVLGTLGLMRSVPAVGLTLLTTLGVVFHAGHALIGIGNKKYSPFHVQGTIEGLTLDKGKCLFLPPRRSTHDY